MSSLKRKLASEQDTADKAAKKPKDARPSKQHNSKDDATTTSTKPRKSVGSGDRVPKNATVSLLKDEEPMFPRGGGSVLTPLEKKQINLDAKADALHEEEFAAGDTSQKKKKRKSAISKLDHKKGDALPKQDTVKVDSLSFTKLVKGSLVLGQVIKINPMSIEVALPNNLTGTISIAAISEQLTSRLQASVDKDDDKDDEDEDDEADAGIDLGSIFSVGQYLRVSVLSTMDEAAAGKGRRKIELSTRPVEANTGLDKSDVVPNSTVMASIVSVEDHGYVMDVGIPGLKAFLPKGEVDSTDEERLQPGAVFLCSSLGSGSGAKVTKLSLKQKKVGSSKAIPSEATTINTFLPGTLVDLLVTQTDSRGVAGKILGHLDATADLIHSGAGPEGADLEKTYKIGSRIKARVICNFLTAREPKLGISLLPHIVSLTSKSLDAKSPTKTLPISSLVEKCVVRHVESGIGLFVDVGIAGLSGFVHISRVKDGKVDALYESSGPFQVGSTHKGRVVAYNEVDGVFQLSFAKAVLEQQFIRVDDVPIGAVVNCTIEKVLINEHGVSGLLLKLSDGVLGLVTIRHLSDVQLQNPEKKFREGMKVKARVLHVNASSRSIRLTLKKTLVNSETPTIKTYDEATVGMHVLGTIVKILPKGAQLRFFGALRGFLPVGEMSEAYIRDPEEHFRVGQVVGVHVLDVNPAENRLIVSCKDPGAFGLDKQKALKSLEVGDIVSAKVAEKTENQVFVELADSTLKATLAVGHLTDKSTSKNQYALKRIGVGQTLTSLVVIYKDERRRIITLSHKPTLVAAAEKGTLLKKFEDAKQGLVVSGFVRNITQTAVFIQFAGDVQALLPKARLPVDTQMKADFGLQKDQSIEVRVVSIVTNLRRILVAPSASPEDDVSLKRTKEKAPAPADDLVLGKVVVAQIVSIKETQLNVQILNSTVQGRIDVSQIFDAADKIENPREPLSKFRRNQQLKARILGIHDAKDHRFLPITHRSAHSVLELTARLSDLAVESLEPLSLNDIRVGDSQMAFVNNVTPQCLWVNLSPTVRGSISAIEASDDLSQLNDLEQNFPVGSAIKVRVMAVDREHNRLDLSARSTGAAEAVTWASVKKNTTLPATITKVNDRQVIVKLSETLAGPIHLPDMADDYDKVHTLAYKNNDLVRVSGGDSDQSNKRLRLSMRPSRVMSSKLPVADREISEYSDVKSGDVVRGFVKNVADAGVFILLGGKVTAMVKIGNLSDSFLKDWKDHFQVDQLVKGRVLPGDLTERMELTLKQSVVDENYVPRKTFDDISVGQIVTGKVRKVQDFGAFILIDDSANVSGLCHRSQMAEGPVEDATKLYREGDVVKAKVLEIDTKKRRISFGLKPSFFEDQDTDMDSDAEVGAALGSDDEAESDVDMSDDGGAMVRIVGTDAMDSDEDEDEDDLVDEDNSGDEESTAPQALKAVAGLGAGKKSDWAADPFGNSDASDADEPGRKDASKKKKRKKTEIQVDRTAELDVNGPQTASDYERLLLGQPDSSELWIAYMAFQMQVSELSKAREVAERAIKTINIREQTEKLNVWTAFLNLEVAYGTKASVEEVFKRASQYNDQQEVHERLASIYIQSDKLKAADELFEVIVKKFGAKSPGVWTNYAHFLHVTKNEPARARALLSRATQQVGNSQDQTLIASRLAALEFRSPNGQAELGRTMFAGLLDAWPKKGDLWSQLLELEMGLADAEPDAVREVFERRTKVKGLKPLQAEKWFRRWATWEEKVDAKGKGKDRVMAKAQDWAAAFKARKEAREAEDVEMEK